jgi:hypothetical protein
LKVFFQNLTLEINVVDTRSPNMVSAAKIAIFEEAARTLDIPGGEKMIQEYYRQMRKFGCNILAVVQQYDIIKDSPVRGAMIGNSKMFVTVGFISTGYRGPFGQDRSISLFNPAELTPLRACQSADPSEADPRKDRASNCRSKCRSESSSKESGILILAPFASKTLRNR